MSKEVQRIGLDIGRGYVKAYSDYNGMKKSTMFKAIVGEGRDLDFKNYDEPIYMNYKNEDWFVGLLAEKESQVVNINSKDSKVTIVAETLFAAALMNTAVADNVIVTLGVPYKSFKKSVLNEVIEKYKGKTFEVKDNINGGTKKITVKDITIFRESDAALYNEIGMVENTKAVGMITVGFRTTELSYFEKGLKFNDKKSKTIEFGNRSVMQIIKDKLADQEILKEINEIDTSDDYNNDKERAYQLATEKIEQIIEGEWVNLNEMDIYIAGGTALKMKFDKQFKVVDDAQMATAKGLYIVAERL